MSTRTRQSSVKLFGRTWFRHQVTHKKGKSRPKFQNVYQVHRHQSVPGVVNFNSFFHETILPRFNTMLSTYNNNLRPMVYRIHLDLIIDPIPEQLSILSMGNLVESELVNYFQVRHRLQFIRKSGVLRGNITFRVGFFPHRYGPPEGGLDVDRPVYIVDAYTQRV